MTSDVVIRATNLSKKYVIGHQAERERYTALRDVMARNARNWARSIKEIIKGDQSVAGDQVEEFWALRDLNFEIRRGDVVGIIGRNGAGKSTLLKILSRITEPSEGRVEIRGRVASLLEVGTGFHPELTGRENIYLNGAILGMRQAEIRRKFDEIVAFAEVSKFLDTPVKRYSSGMYVRLAFAVAAHLEPEILIIDEVLAVGDAEFQKKCLGKMKDVAGHGRTVLFVSHNMAAIRALCPRGLLLKSGTLIADGQTIDVIQNYSSPRATALLSLGSRAELNQIDVRQSASTQELNFDITLTLKTAQTIQHLAIIIYGDTGTRLCVVDLRGAISLPINASAGRFRVRGTAYPMHLVEKEYSVSLHFGSDDVVEDFNSLSLLTPQPRAAARRYDLEHLGFFDIQRVVANVSRDGSDAI